MPGVSGLGFRWKREKSTFASLNHVADEVVVLELRDRHVLVVVHRRLVRACVRSKSRTSVSCRLLMLSSADRAVVDRVAQLARTADPRGTASRRCRCTVAGSPCRAPRNPVGAPLKSTRLERFCMLPSYDAEDVQLVLDDRAADAQRRERAVVRRLGERRRLARRASDAVGDVLVAALEAVELHEALVLIAHERAAGPFVRARLRRRGDHRARRLLILRLEVLADDAVFLDRVLRKRIAAARVLAGDAAAGEIVLEARAVDEQVDRVRRLPARLDRAEVRAS